MNRIGLCSSGKIVPLICPLLFLAACSGGGAGDIGAGIPVVTPLDGQWSTDAGEAIQFGGFSSDELHFSDELNVDATIENPQFICEGAINDFGFLDLSGSIRDGYLTLFVPDTSSETPCMTGMFTDLRTLRMAAVGGLPERLFQNTRVDVDMEFGLWTSSDAGSSLRLKFESPQSVNNDSVGENQSNGCVLVSGGDDVRFTGFMNGFDTVNSVNPVIPELVSSEPGSPVIFTQLVFVDDENVRLLDADGHQRSLVRVPDVDETDCP